MKAIHEAFHKGLFVLDLKARNTKTIFQQVLNFLVTQEELPLEKRDQVEKALLDRDAEGSTAIGHATALPHAYLEGLEKPLIAFVRLQRPLNLGAPDGIPTRYFFVLLGPTDSAAVHIETLMHIAQLMSDDEFRYELGAARTRTDLLEAFANFHERVAQAPTKPPREVPEGLRFTGRLAGGLIGDIRRRWPNYLQDFRDGLNLKVLGAAIFLFFACIAPSVTFGGVMEARTHGQIGAVEMIAASALCGVLYALFSGQPLIILGGTGPLLIITVILYDLCEELSVPFLPTYTCVGLWTMLFLLILAVTDASALMRYFTRFTDEVFAALISLIYIYEAVHAVYLIFKRVYSTELTHDTAFLTLMLALGTFFIALNLSRINRSRYLLPKMREFLTDFGPMIALGLMTATAWMFSSDVHLINLKAPESFGPTMVGRSWLLSPFDAPRWVWFASAVPALLVAVLFYLDQNITSRLVNSADNKLRRGEAYHLDLVVVGLLVGVCSMFGLPWHVAATVRSLNHIRSLATVEEVVGSNGERREQIVHVCENRLSGLGIHLLVGGSLLLLPLLKTIPMAVLYGIFLYMGVVSMKGNQFFERMSLWFMDSALYPSTHYIRRAPLNVIHQFTLVQVIALGTLWWVKTADPMIAIWFPMIIGLLVPVRLLMNRYFQPEHLAVLDAEETPDEEGSDWGSG